VRDAPEYRGCVVLFQLGGFFEAFFADAALVADVCGITLTAKGGASFGGSPIPMAGIPVERADAHVGRLLRRGLRVVLVEQSEAPGGGAAPAPAGAGRAPAPGGVLARRVSRVLTPATAPELWSASPTAGHAVAALALLPGGRCAVASADLASGALTVRAARAADVAAALAALAPVEIVLPSEDASVGPPPPPLAPGAGAAGAAAAGASLTVEAAARAAAGAVAGTVNDAAAAAYDDDDDDRAGADGGLAGAADLLRALARARRAGAADADAPGGGGGGGARAHAVARVCLGGAHAADADAGGALCAFVAPDAFSRAAGLAAVRALPHAAAAAALGGDAARLSDAELAALGGLLGYVRWAMAGRAPRLGAPVRLEALAPVSVCGGRGRCAARGRRRGPG
jgi:hypothetical protein